MYHYDAVNPDANLDAQHRIAKNLRFLRIAHTISHIPAALCIIPVISHQLRVYDFI